MCTCLANTRKKNTTVLVTSVPFQYYTLSKFALEALRGWKNSAKSENVKWWFKYFGYIEASFAPPSLNTHAPRSVTPVLPYALFCKHSCKTVRDLPSAIRQPCGPSFDHTSFVDRIRKKIRVNKHKSWIEKEKFQQRECLPSTTGKISIWLPISTAKKRASRFSRTNIPYRLQVPYIEAPWPRG